MANTKATSNEEIIAALLQCGTVKEAAAAAGTTPRTVYDRMNDREFRGLYMAAKTDVIRKALNNINGKLSEAVDTVAAIMTDTSANPATRLQAAQVLLSNAAKLSEKLYEGERISRELMKPPLFPDFD